MQPSRYWFEAAALIFAVFAVWAIFPKSQQRSFPVILPVQTGTANETASISFADPATGFAIQQALGWSLARESIQQNSGVSYVEFPAISSGVLIPVTLPVDGSPVVDALVVYLPTKAGVVQLPVMIGFDKGGRYLYYDASLPSDKAMQFTRDQALEAVRTDYKRGKALSLTMFKYVRLEGVDWTTCTSQEKDHRFSEGCRLAQEYNRLYPEAERLFISKIPVDGEWMPVGWWFTPYYQDLQVSLP